MKIYAVYKGEEFLYEGTVKECAKYFGVQENAIYRWNAKSYKKKAESTKINGKPRKRKIAIVLEGE